MKGEVMPSIVQIDKAHLSELVQEVRETLATDMFVQNREEKKKAFRAVDLWKIHREMKSANRNFKSQF
ncbi:MAG TPA: hypothetical protein VJA82_11035 [Sediminibacterium sp.]|jgi:hypothetical protein|uniref:hypothetical protein n=1 Tax=Sediminibacterium sp. TaxID=1917865 RepID=UPI0008BCBB83|nr:hypothetical protein [Sediminibacterium sp.]OHC84224.1 MAG: hypothetical protein A2472_12240 [Sphingobacteriia bacterium RIFOXYC2_FULL_35_18]OHC88825.1 MAG: hypothetical protein A2546_02945 [Sphingobacteriia bacterium RIFOXYD2_FULL_35_12]HLD53831.1 hypothetical protein [Sediminibacterium sp.]